MRDTTYIEMFDESEPTPTRGTPAQSPIDDPLFEYLPSNGAAQLLAAKLEHRHFVSEMLGTETFAKRVPPGLFEITPTARPPLNPNSYVAEFPDLPLPLSDDEMRSPQLGLCNCDCPQCREQRRCSECSADTKCANSKCDEAEKAHGVAIARIVGEAKGQAHGYAIKDRAEWNRLWSNIEKSMLNCLNRTLASAF